MYQAGSTLPKTLHIPLKNGGFSSSESPNFQGVNSPFSGGPNSLFSLQGGFEPGALASTTLALASGWDAFAEWSEFPGGFFPRASCTCVVRRCVSFVGLTPGDRMMQQKKTKMKEKIEASISIAQNAWKIFGGKESCHWDVRVGGCDWEVTTPGEFYPLFSGVFPGSSTARTRPQNEKFIFQPQFFGSWVVPWGQKRSAHCDGFLRGYCGVWLQNAGAVSAMFVI